MRNVAVLVLLLATIIASPTASIPVSAQESGETETVAASSDRGDAKPPRGDGGESEKELSFYESPHYNYSLAFDPELWEVFSEDSDTEDDYDQILLSANWGPIGVVSLLGDPFFDPGDVTGCVETYEGILIDNDDVSDVTPIRGGSGDDEGRAWASFRYVFAGSSGDLDSARYMECIALDDVMLVILQSSAEVDFDEISDGRVDLLKGLEH